MVSVLLPLAVNFTLRSKTQRRIEFLGTVAISASRVYCSQNGRGSWTGRRPGWLLLPKRSCVMLRSKTFLPRALEALG